MKKLAYLFCLMGLLASGNAYGMMPDLKLPFDAGLSWYMTRGYKTGTHIKYTNVDDAYVLTELQFIAKINTQPLGVQQGDVWIETPDGNWNHRFILFHISDNGNGFHTYQAQFTKGLIINQFSIELTKNNADEKWEFDEIDLMGRVSIPSGLMIK